MKTILILSSILLISLLGLIFQNSCKQDLLSRNHFNSKTLNYKVYKLDTINNYYIIYAKKQDSLFKIISKKDSSINCKMIKINNCYKFKLHSILKVNGKFIIPLNQIYEISGWRIDEFTTIKFEGDSIRDLYNCSNIKGLCFIK